ncbi:MAG: glycosyltransferase [Rhizobiaceae bacterium]
MQRLPDIPPRLSDDIAFLTKNGFDFQTLQQVERRARKLNLSAATVLIRSGFLTQTTYYRCMAHELGVGFVQQPPLNPTPISELPEPEELQDLARVQMTTHHHAEGEVDCGRWEYHLAPDANMLQLLRKHLARSAEIARCIKVTSHQSNLNNLIKRSSVELLRNATESLHQSLPQYSAKRVITKMQAACILLLICAIAGLWLAFGTIVPIVLHLFAMALYLGRAAMRFSAWKGCARADIQPVFTQIADEDLTPYSILVALYEEENQVNGLVAALSDIDWPAEYLEVKLICEADDHATLQACQRAIDSNGLSHFSVVKVPDGQPRTKPRALNYALPLCVGEFVVVYDAEDRPHPQQLKQAYQAFRSGPPNLSCLQAPLVIDNHHQHWLPRLFAIEYSALFDGLLPALARRQLPLPLGGSSNHFERHALVNIGAWDPYNVTEDADLGLRLARAGCITGVLSCPTFETAPIELDVWLRQRTRWFKGWYQTFLVHTRTIWQLKKELNSVGFIAFHLMTFGLALSALAYPFLGFNIAAIALDLLQDQVPLWKKYLLGLDIACILIGFGVYGLLASRTLALRKMSALCSSLWLLPIYWMLMSAAAWRALWQLFSDPHKWEKTPHLPRHSNSESNRRNSRHEW